MKQRVNGFDVARALAIFGMVVVNFKIAMNAETGNQLLMGFAGLFEGRASALFVILAGIGVTLMTNKTRESGYYLAEGTRIYVKETGTPTSGNVYLTTFYGAI